MVSTSSIQQQSRLLKCADEAVIKIAPQYATAAPDQRCHCQYCILTYTFAICSIKLLSYLLTYLLNFKKAISTFILGTSP